MPQWRLLTTTRYPISLCEATSSATSSRGRTLTSSLLMKLLSFMVATQRPVTESS